MGKPFGGGNSHSLGSRSSPARRLRAPLGHRCAPELARPGVARALLRSGFRAFLAPERGELWPFGILSGAPMADEEYPAKHALLVAELEAAKLENESAEQIAGVAKELLELSLGQGDAEAARGELAELRAVALSRRPRQRDVARLLRRARGAGGRRTCASA